LGGGRKKSKLDREDESNRTIYKTKNMLERRVRQKGTGWSQSRKTGWTEQKKRWGQG